MSTRDMPTALLPINFTSRDLDGALVLASLIAGSGYRAVVGYKGTLSDIGRASEKVVWFGSDGLYSERSNKHLADRLVENDSAIIFAQEEGGIFPAGSWEESTLFKHNVHNLKEGKVSAVAVWGERQQRLISSHCPVLDGRVRVTGSPRLDLCRPRYEWMADRGRGSLQSRQQPYVLVCSRFTSVAHMGGLAHAFSIKVNKKLRPLKHYANIDDRSLSRQKLSEWRQDVHDFTEFMVMVRELAIELANYTIVLRPHPSESATFYEQALGGLKNVIVSKDGSVLDWIRSAELVMHCNCTTGIEAVLAERPVLNFKPTLVERSGQDIEVAREAGCPVTSTDSAIQKSKELLAVGKHQQTWSPQATSVLNNLKEEAIPNVIDEVTRQLETIGTSKLAWPGSGNPITRNALSRRLLRSLRRASYDRDAKRTMLEQRYVSEVLDGCRSNGSGGGRIEFLTGEFVAITPL